MYNVKLAKFIDAENSARYTISSVEVRISELFEIRIYSDYFGDRLPMPQIRIFEVTIFRVFFCDFYEIVYQFVSGQEFIYWEFKVIKI